MKIQSALCCLTMLVLAGCFDGAGVDADAGAQGAAAGCTSSGGTLTLANCCRSAEPFPNTCAVGACGCSLENSEEIQVCECPAGMCFDGARCVSR